MSDSTQLIAERIAVRFQERMKAKDGKALKKLVTEIELALSDEREGRASRLNEKPVPEPVRQPTLKEIACDKIARNLPLTDAEEDAMIWEGM